METIVKINIFKMKEDIKTKSEEQKFLKNQRKTVHIKGERKMSATDATYKVQENTEKLRALYAAYGLARGKSFSQIENHYPEENHPLQKIQYKIDKIMENYKILEEVNVQSEI
jgi:hypothetical protein